MPITLRGVGAGTNSSAASASPALPTGMAAGDVSILCAVGSTGTTVFTPPSGWNVVYNIKDFMLCWRAWQSGDTNPTVTSSGQSWSSYDIIAYSGCDTSAPIDQVNGCVLIDDSLHVAPKLRAPSCAPKYASGQLVCFFGIATASSGTSITLASGLTSQLAYTAGPSLTIGDKSISSASATGNYDSTQVADKPTFGAQVLLKASSASTVSQAAAFINEGGVYQAATANLPSGTVTVHLDRLGVQTGDLVCLAVYSQAAITGPSGWTQQQSSSDGALFTHVQGGGDTSTPTFSLGASGWTTYTAVVLRDGINNDTKTISVDTTGQVTSASSTTVTSSNLTPATTADFLALFAGSKQTTGGNLSISAGPTLDMQNGSGPVAAFAWENPSANPSGTFTWTDGSSQATLTAWTLLAKLAAPVAQHRPLQMLVM
jgi:hypothetical protein